MRQVLHLLVGLATLAVPVVAWNWFPVWLGTPVGKTAASTQQPRMPDAASRPSTTEVPGVFVTGSRATGERGREESTGDNSLHSSCLGEPSPDTNRDELPKLSSIRPNAARCLEEASCEEADEPEQGATGVMRLRLSRVPAIAGVHTLVGFCSKPPCDKGNCFSLGTGESIVNMHLENFESIVRMLGLRTVQIERIDEGTYLIADPAIPNEWLLDAPCPTCVRGAEREKILAKHADRFRKPSGGALAPDAPVRPIEPELRRWRVLSGPDTLPSLKMSFPWRLKDLGPKHE